MFKKIQYKVNNNFEIFFWSIISIIMGIFIIAYYAYFGNSIQVFNDITVENIAFSNTNKSMELLLFRIVIYTGVILYLLNYYKRYLCCNEILSKEIFKKNGDEFTSDIFLITPIVFALVEYVIYGMNIDYIIPGIVITLILFFKNKSVTLIGILFFYLCNFCIAGIYRVYVILGGIHTLNDNIVPTISFIISCIYLLSRAKEDIYKKGILLVQLFIPFTIATTVVSDYIYDNEIIHIPNESSSVIWFIIVLFVAENCINIKNNWNKINEKGNLDNIISLGSCISIAFFSFVNTHNIGSAIMPTDMHHPFENIISYTEIFQYEQIPLEEYIPVSGFYSVIQGAFFQCLGNGQFSNYYFTEDVFYLFITTITIGLMTFHLKKEYIFFISMCISLYSYKIGDIFFSYNRGCLVLPIILLLILPKLLERRDVWVLVWLITSFLHILYYPLLGVAVCIGFLPLAIYQIYNIYILKLYKSNIVILETFVCLLLAILLTPIFFKFFLHIQAMAGQTVLADGIVRYGQSVRMFFPIFGDRIAIKMALYDYFTIMIPSAVIWCGCVITFRGVGKPVLLNNKIIFQDIQGFCISFALIIVPIISYTYTLVRLDEGSLVNRSYMVISPIVVLMIIIAQKYIKEIDIKKNVILFSMCLLACSNYIGLSGYKWNLSAMAKVPDSFCYVNDRKEMGLGEGFLHNNIYDYINKKHDYNLEHDNRYYFAMEASLGYSYLKNIHSVSVIEPYTLKSYNATKETVEVIKKNKAIVGASVNQDSFKLNSFTNYYLFNYLLTSGDYIWNKEQNIFEFNENYMRKEDVFSINKSYDGVKNKLDCVGRAAASLGQSYTSLEKIFTSVDITYQTIHNSNQYIIEFEKEISGENLDFLYIKLDDDLMRNYEYVYDNQFINKPGFLGRNLMRKEYNPNLAMCISWKSEDDEDCSVECLVQRGQLLIPLGAGRKWLLNNHNVLRIQMFKDGLPIEIPKILEIKMLKLQTLR